jgi:hypothetical protein
MEDKELKKRLNKIPDIDKNGDPIYKIDGICLKILKMRSRILGIVPIQQTKANLRTRPKI